MLSWYVLTWTESLAHGKGCIARPTWHSGSLEQVRVVKMRVSVHSRDYEQGCGQTRVPVVVLSERSPFWVTRGVVPLQTGTTRVNWPKILNFLVPPGALTRHRHGAGVENPKEVFLVTLVQKDHCVSMTHATLGKRAHFGEAVLKTLRLTSWKNRLGSADQGTLKYGCAVV